MPVSVCNILYYNVFAGKCPEKPNMCYTIQRLKQELKSKEMDEIMLNQYSRTQLLIGKDAMDRLEKATVAVFGIGGVGGYVCEALVRTGVKHFVLIDDDRVCLTNLNRQIHALRSTVGKYKAEVMRDRMLDIEPKADIRIVKSFYLPENADQLDFHEFDYAADCVDTVTAKIEIIMRAKREGIPVISCMGAGNHLDPTSFRIADIYKTEMCPLAKVMRHELKKRGVRKLKVVYSTEKPVRPLEDMSISCRTHCICPPGTVHKCTDRRDIPGSIAFGPSVAGLFMASEIVKDLCREELKEADKEREMYKEQDRRIREIANAERNKLQ